MPKKKKFRVRKFLNTDPEMSAFIIANVEGFSHNTDKKGKKYLNCGPTLNIADCYRKISLDLYFSDEIEYKQSINKLNTLIDTITGMRNFLEEEKQIYDDRS
jgi:hypothetical protein